LLGVTVNGAVIVGFVSPNESSGLFRQNPTFVMAGLDPAIHEAVPQIRPYDLALDP
jgi:hypothetical protein